MVDLFTIIAVAWFVLGFIFNLLCTYEEDKDITIGDLFSSVLFAFGGLLLVAIYFFVCNKKTKKALNNFFTFKLVKK